jgi:hypothetical protein
MTTQMLIFPSGSNNRRKISIIVAVLLVVVWYYNSLRNRRYLLRAGVISPKLSPWNHLFHHGDDLSFMEMTGFSRNSFSALVNILWPLDTRRNIGNKRGRPSSLDENGQLGLLLFYLGSRMNIKHLCLLFGVVPSTVSSVIKDIIKLLIHKLIDHPSARISLKSSPISQARTLYFTSPS